MSRKLDYPHVTFFQDENWKHVRRAELVFFLERIPATCCFPEVQYNDHIVIRSTYVVTSIQGLLMLEFPICHGMPPTSPTPHRPSTFVLCFVVDHVSSITTVQTFTKSVRCNTHFARRTSTTSCGRCERHRDPCLLEDGQNSVFWDEIGDVQLLHWSSYGILSIICDMCVLKNIATVLIAITCALQARLEQKLLHICRDILEYLYYV